jgi:hypothetical protein
VKGFLEYMNRQQLQVKVKQLVHQMIHEKQEASPIELFIRMDKLNPKLVQEWRAGKVPYLERLMQGSLSQLSFIMSVYRKTASEMGLQAVIRSYTRWGKGPRQSLRFSKSGDVSIERGYSTHYVKKKTAGTPTDLSELEPEGSD